MQPQKPSVATDNYLQHVSVAKALAGNIGFGIAKEFDSNGVPTLFIQDNGDGQMLRFSFVAANTDTAISHTLNRIPNGYLLMRSNVPMQLYDAMTNAGWTKTQIVIKSSAVADTVIYIF